MAKFAAINLDDVPASSTYAIAQDVSGVAWSKRASPEDYALWLVVSELTGGAVMRWGSDHGDEAVCVLEGALDVDGAAARRAERSSSSPVRHAQRRQLARLAWRITGRPIRRHRLMVYSARRSRAVTACM